MSDDLLTAVDLKKHFVVGRKGGARRVPVTVRAVDGVSFSLREGETLGLVGESGSGKSTVAYTTVGMYRPTSGRLIFRGQDLFSEKRRRPQQLRKEIQIVFQDPGSSLNPRHTINEILSMPLRVHQPAHNRVEQIVHLLETVDMPPEYMYQYPHTLSGGEKQIVGIARALASDPQLVILDEPTSALDVSVQAKTITLLLRLQRELGLSYLFITHDLSLMRNVAIPRGHHVPGQDLRGRGDVRLFQEPAPPLHADAALLHPGDLGRGGGAEAAQSDLHRRDPEPGRYPLGVQLPYPVSFRHGYLPAGGSGDGGRISRAPGSLPSL